MWEYRRVSPARVSVPLELEPAISWAASEVAFPKST